MSSWKNDFELELEMEELEDLVSVTINNDKTMHTKVGSNNKTSIGNKNKKKKGIIGNVGNLLSQAMVSAAFWGRSRSSSSSSAYSKSSIAVICIVCFFSLALIRSVRGIGGEREQSPITASVDHGTPLDMSDSKMTSGNSNESDKNNSGKADEFAVSDKSSSNDDASIMPVTDYTSGEDDAEGKREKLGQQEPEEIEEVEKVNPEYKLEKNMDWGHWGFWDGAENDRPKGDYCGEFRNRDISESEWPTNAWQTDAVYVNHMLDAAEKLISRAKKAIYAEYGHDDPKSTKERILRRDMFHAAHIDDTGQLPEGWEEKAGWITQTSYDALVKRLLHAMMTNDSFTVVIGGNSEAAGYGNHFNQSYAMQFYDIMEPIFARMGTKLITHNMAQGGDMHGSAAHTSLGSQSIYGNEIDLIIWDGGEIDKDGSNNDPYLQDLFWRQALLGGNRPSFLLGIGGSTDVNVMKTLHENITVDIAMLGSGMIGVPTTQNENQVKSLPWLARYLKCDDDDDELCEQKDHKFNSKCWVERDDVTPHTRQNDVCPGQDGEFVHGWRRHRLKSRLMSFLILEALDNAVSLWTEVTMVEGDPLADEYWHISEYYDSLQQKISSLQTTAVGLCNANIGHALPERVCNVAMQGRTEYTPVKNYNSTLRSILKGERDGSFPSPLEPQYTGFDVPNPALELPEDALDTRSIVSARKLITRKNGGYVCTDCVRSHKQNNAALQNSIGSVPHLIPSGRFLETNETNITPGTGWSIKGGKAGFCNGTLSSQCGREENNNCLLSGYNDDIGTLMGDGSSGWLVMELKNLQNGLLIVRGSFGKASSDSRKLDSRIGGLDKRRLSSDDDDSSHNGVFEFAINGVITSWNIDKLVDEVKYLYPEKALDKSGNFGYITLLDDTSKKLETAEISLRLKDCGKECVFQMSHIYWS